jgi:hypothetical protein
MQTLESLGEQAAADALRRGTLDIRTGPFTTRVLTEDALVVAALHSLYAAHPVRLAPDFSDFHVEVRPVSGPRRWARRQVTFLFDGREPFKPLPAVQSFALFEWGLNWCIASSAHRWLMMHAAVLARGGDAVVLPAPPGSGKSTLCAALTFNGWRLLSDELVVLDPETGEVWPLVRPINVKNQSIDVVRNFVPGVVMAGPVPDTLKGTVAHVAPPAEAVSAISQRARIRWIVFPTWQRGAATALDAMSPGEVFPALIENAFNYEVLGEDGFDALSVLARSARGFRFRYSDLREALRAFDGLAQS